jgi:aspartate racemase
MGASIIALPCNTAHILYERYLDLTVEMPHMVVQTREAVIRRCGQIPKVVAVFSSKLTEQYGLYHEIFKQKNIALHDISCHQAEVSNLIEQVKQGARLAPLAEKMHALCAIYQHVDAFVMGCTELSLLAQHDFEGVPVIDSNIALAEACLALSNNEVFNQVS